VADRQRPSGISHCSTLVWLANLVLLGASLSEETIVVVIELIVGLKQAQIFAVYNLF